MTLQMNSQPTSKDIGRVRALEINGDTLIQMHLLDAKTVLKGVLDGEIADSLLNIFMVRDSINSEIIQMQVSQIRLLQEKSKNQAQLNDNLNTIIKNKDLEITKLNAIIVEQKKQIKKERFVKKLSLIGNVVIPAVLIVLFLVN
jgi:hypothetical protein